MTRPSTYKPEYCKKLIEYMSDGLSFDSFGAEVNASRPTLYTWVKTFPEFAAAKHMADLKCQQWWERTGIRGLFCGEKEKFNATVWIFNMKNRFRWHDRQEVQHELGEGMKQAMLDIKQARQIIHADPIDIQVITDGSDT